MKGQEAIRTFAALTGVDTNREKIIEKQHFFKADVSNGTQILRVLDSNTVSKPGESSFHNGELPKGEYYMVTELRLAELGGTVMNGGLYTNVFTDAALANSKFSFWQDSKRLFEGEISRFRLQANSTNGYVGMYRELDAPWVITGGMPVECRIEVANGRTIGADLFLEVQMHGIQNFTR